MTRICILTDSTAQFTQPNFPGHERVFVIPMGVEAPRPAAGKLHPALQPPAVQDFKRFYTHLAREHDAIVVMPLSSRLSSSTEHALKAAHAFNDHAAVQVIDTQTTSVGLGMLVELAASLSASGAALAEVERQVRSTIKNIYTLVCVSELTRLVGLGLLSQAQAVAGEILGMQPVFVLEEGGLSLLDKVRSPRQLFEAFEEFLSEFTAPRQIALLRGTSHIILRTRPLRQFVQETFPAAAYSEHALNQPLALLFGPQCIGLTVLDPDKKI